MNMPRAYHNLSPRLCVNVLAVVTLIGALTATPRAARQEDERRSLPGVTLTLVSQKPIHEGPPYAREQGGDVFEVVKDDLRVRFRLTNGRKEKIYYLASIYDPKPTGYVLYKKEGDTEWKATTPARGREGSLTGGGYEWRPLAPYTSVEFEFTDLSEREGEHAVSVLVNTRPVHDRRAEIISESYYPAHLDGNPEGQ